MNKASNERSDFDQYLESHGKTYGTQEEYEFRFGLYQETVTKIQEFEINDNSTLSLGVNHFADLTEHEKKSMLISKVTKNNHHSTFTGFRNPESIDWRTKGVISPVRNQN